MLTNRQMLQVYHYIKTLSSVIVLVLLLISNYKLKFILMGYDIIQLFISYKRFKMLTRSNRDCISVRR